MKKNKSCVWHVVIMNMNKVGKEKTAAAELIVGNKETETHKTSHMDQFSSRRQFDREEQGQKSEKWLCVHWKKGKKGRKCPGTY